MLKHPITKRLFQVLITLIGISFISFLLQYISPTDPVRAMYAVTGQIPSEEILEQIREEMGLNRPFIVQYFDWLWSCLQGDFGVSYSLNQPVSQLLMARLIPTVKLALLSLAMMTVIAVPLGMISALYQNRIADYIVRMLTFVQISMPNFWVGILLLYYFGVKLGWFNVVSTEMNFEKMVLPALTLAIAMAGKYARQVRTALLEEMNQNYVTGAKARGLSDRAILWQHIVPNAMLPLITLLGLSLGSLLGGTAVVEIIFSYPALGSLAIQAITSMDYPLVQGFVMWIALAYMIVNIVVDISYEYLDPRLKRGA